MTGDQPRGVRINFRNVAVRTLTAQDIAALRCLRRAAILAHPFAFGASVEEDAAVNAEFIAASLADPNQSAVYGAFIDHKLVGIVGVFRHSGQKTRHRAQLWGVYVSPTARGQGIARSLMEAALAHVRQWSGVLQVHLAVSELAQDARALYHSFGFRVWGLEPRALQWEGRFSNEYHLVLALDDR